MHLDQYSSLEGINQPLVVHQQTPSALLMKTPQTFEGETATARRTKMKADVLFEEKKRSRTAGRRIGTGHPRATCNE